MSDEYTWYTGYQYGYTGNSQWSSNATSVATIQTTGQSSPGMASGVSAGSAQFEADFGQLPVNAGQICTQGTLPPCPTGSPVAQAQGSVYQVLCSPSPITRAATITCTVSGVSASQVSSWQFSSSNGNISGAAAGQTTWSGAMVQSGTVQVNLTTGGSAQANVTVTPRTNFAVSLPSPTLVANGASGLPTLTTPPTNSGEDAIFGAARFGFNFSDGAISVSSGPNTGFVYINSFNDTSVFVYELNPGITNSSDPFYQHQYGACGIPSAATIVAAVTAHEAGSTNSHWSEVSSALASSNPGTVAEGSVGSPGTNPSTWIVSSINPTIQAAYQSAATAGGVEPPTNLPNNINYVPYTTCP